MRTTFYRPAASPYVSSWLARWGSRIRIGKRFRLQDDLKLYCVCGPQCYGEPHAFDCKRFLDEPFRTACLIDIHPGPLPTARLQGDGLPQVSGFNDTMSEYHRERQAAWEQVVGAAGDAEACASLAQEGLGQEFASSGWPVFLISGLTPEEQAFEPTYAMQNCKFVRPLSDHGAGFLHCLGLRQWQDGYTRRLFHPRITFAVRNERIVYIRWRWNNPGQRFREVLRDLPNLS